MHGVAPTLPIQMKLDRCFSSLVYTAINGVIVVVDRLMGLRIANDRFNRFLCRRGVWTLTMLACATALSYNTDIILVGLTSLNYDVRSCSARSLKIKRLSEGLAKRREVTV